MATHYRYDYRDHHQPLNRKLRFWVFTLIILLIVLSFFAGYYYRTHWSETGFTTSYWNLISIAFALLTLLGLLLVWLSKKMKWGYNNNFQFLEVDQQQIAWRLASKETARSLEVAEIAGVEEDHRHLIITTKTGEKIWLEGYLLIGQDEAWKAFVAAVKEVVSPSS